MSSKGTLTTGATGRSPPEKLGTTTRSQKSKTTTQQASITPQAATLEKKKTKVKDIEVEACKLLLSEGCLTDEDSISHNTILNALTLVIQKYSASAPQDLAKALAAIVTLLKQANYASEATKQCESAVDALSQKVGERIEKTMQDEMGKMSTMIKRSLAEQKEALSPQEGLVETVTTLKQVASDMSKTINEATTATNQINDTALNYKQALLQSTTQAPQWVQARAGNNTYVDKTGAPHNIERREQTDPRILRDIDRKARQILIDTIDPSITNASQTEIKEKVNAAIATITTSPPPEDTTVIEVIKLRKGGCTILFKDKEAVNWLQDLKVEKEFTEAFAIDAILVKRSYSILVPRIPLTFDPANEDHLREVEECNSVPTGTITKARWIKPMNRRVPGQRAAHAIFTISDITLANEYIRDGIKVCGLHIRPSRLKHEPMQCMKCRRWGHFAHACTASADTCGTCGEEHRTSECSNKGKTHCVSCKSDEHASWDRTCPEFLRRCDQYDENYPENSLPYFPSEESWTLTPRPSKLQRAEKFPAKYAVAPLQQQRRTDREAPSKAQNKHPKQRNAKLPPNQATLDMFINAGNAQKTDMSTSPNLNDADAAAPSDLDSVYPTFNYINPYGGYEPRGWN